MRRICLMLLAVALAAPGLAVAADRSLGDGSLAVSGASGTIVVQGSGVIYGHFDQGTLLVLSYRPDDGLSAPAVSISRAKFTRSTGSFSGSDVRFLLPSGRYVIELIATGVDLSAVGKGSIVATGAADPVGVLPIGAVNGTFSINGSYSVNGGRPVPLLKGSSSDTFGGK